MPTSTPSPKPTIRPTSGVTNAPTGQQGDQIQVDFDVSQTIGGLDYDDYNANKANIDEAFLTTAASAMQLQYSDGTPDTSGLTITDVTSTTRRLSTVQTASTTGLQFDYNVKFIVGVDNDFSSADQGYNQAVANLDASISDNSFEISLQDSGVPALSSATADEVPTVTQPTQTVLPPPTNQGSNDDALSGGDIAGIVVGVIVAVGLISVGGIYYQKQLDHERMLRNIASSSSSSSAGTENPLHNNL